MLSLCLSQTKRSQKTLCSSHVRGLSTSHPPFPLGLKSVWSVVRQSSSQSVYGPLVTSISLIVSDSERYTVRKVCAELKRKIHSDDGPLMIFLPFKRSRTVILRTLNKYDGNVNKNITLKYQLALFVLYLAIIPNRSTCTMWLNYPLTEQVVTTLF